MGGGICMTWGIVRLGFGGRRIGGNLQGKESTRSATQRGSVLRKEAPVARLGLSMSQAAACEVLVFHAGFTFSFFFPNPAVCRKRNFGRNFAEFR